MCRARQTFLPAVLAVVMITASATLTVGQPAAAANLSEDAQTLLQEQTWAEAFLWSSSTRMCDWAGVSECDASGSHITSLIFNYSQLIAKTIDDSSTAVPLVLPDSWSNLTQLRIFRYNIYLPIAGPLPSSWSKLENLSEFIVDGFQFHGQGLNGSLPEAWGSMRNLEKVTISGQALQGSIPASWRNLPSLTSLDLRSNNLTGTAMEPWINMANLHFLHLSNNNLTGTLPESWRIASNLSELFLHGNSLSGTLPESWSALSNLSHLTVNDNNLSGTLPEPWSTLSNLSSLFLHGNSLSGTLPESWSALSNLSHLTVNDNNLSGTLPEPWSALSNLFQLSLEHNNLTGTAPEAWGRICVLSLSGISIDGLSADQGPTQCYFARWTLSGLTHCPYDTFSHLFDTGSPTCDNDIVVDKDSWEHCKRKQLLEACISNCITLSNKHPDLCVAKHAGVTLILLWCTLAGLLSIMFCMYIVVRIKLNKRDPGENSKFSHLINKAKQGWSRAMQWRPWGVKAAALLGLATFWYDKGSDVKLLSDVFGHTWTGYALLVLLLYQYVLQGYILIFHLIRARKFTWVFAGSLFKILRLNRPLYFAFMLCPVTGALMMTGLDVTLFVSDLGYSVPFIDRHFDLEEYQLFRDIGRALFGTVPTAILQSVTFTTGSTPQNGLVLTTQTFVSAIVASELQLVKVTGELMYLALQGKAGMHTVFWRLLVGKHVVREALESKSSDLLPQGQIISSQPDVQ